MPRAHRNHLPGHIWHLTHRCHRRQFLLRFARDRRRWRRWLYEARKRYGLCVLNYTVTCNHIHLLVLDQGRGEIAAGMQLIAGRTAQTFNRRKERAGAFWQDRYHATAVENGEHLARCVVYIDLNMVRAGTVDHPQYWEVGGYHEIQCDRPRCRIVNRHALAEALGVELALLAEVHRGWVNDALRTGQGQRESLWTESVAVGRQEFVEGVRRELGDRGRHRRVERSGNMHVLRDPSEAYGVHFAFENARIRCE